MSEKSQIVVCGAGPVGLAVALKFARAGLDVTVIEADYEINDSPRACIYLPSVQEGLDTLNPGLLNEIRDISHVNNGISWFSPDLDWSLAVDAPPEELGPYAKVLHVGQEEVGAVLLKHLEAYPNVKIRWGARLTMLEEEEESITLHIATSVGTEIITCEWLIGADGAGSTVRGLAGIKFEGHTWPERFFAANVTFDFNKIGLKDANARWNPDSYAVIVKVNKQGVWRIAFGEDGSLPSEDAIERATARLSEFIPEGEEYQLLRLRPYNLHQRAAETLRKGRILLAGDAAHATNPVGGLGLSTGMWEAFILGDLLPAVINQELNESALDAYSEARLKVFWEATSPMATQNKTMMQERDSELRKQNMAAMEGMLSSKEGMIGMVKSSYAFIGDPILPNSPWQKYNQPAPTK